MKLEIDQQKVVFALWIILVAGFAASVPGFLSPGNLLSLVQGVSVLGIIALGLAIVVIGRGIDLSIVAVMAVSAAFTFRSAGEGTGLAIAAMGGLGLAIAIGLVSGWLIAWIEIPPLFVTLPMGSVVYGFGRLFLFEQDVIDLPRSSGGLRAIGQSQLAGIPMPVLIFALAAAGFAAFLAWTRTAWFIYAIGDNPQAARTSGLPTRRIIMVQYMVSAMVGFVAGIVLGTSLASINTRIVSSTLLYDVILVVVLGGISLSGGKGGVGSVLAGTLLLGTLLNGLTVLNVPYTLQNVIKGVLLLVAIIADSLINPRDEQTAQQGDI